MEKHVLVHVDIGGSPHLAGRLWAHVRQNRESATFEYDRTWLGHPQRFALEPAIELGAGPFHTPSRKPLFGALGDSAPDRWGNYFDPDASTARAITAEVGAVVRTWRAAAARLGLSPREIDRTASAFEHDDLDAAVRSRARAATRSPAKRGRKRGSS